MNRWFDEQLAMYMAYHRTPINCATHFIGVPLIVFALLMPLSLLQFGQVSGIHLSADAMVLALVLMLYSAVMPLMGFMAGLFLIPLLYLAHVTARLGVSMTWIISATCFTCGWSLQFIGHIAEGRRPAFCDNIIQLLIAPCFLILEVLFAMGFLRSLKVDLQQRSRKYDDILDESL